MANPEFCRTPIKDCSMLRLVRRLRLITVCATASLVLIGGCATPGTGDPRDPFEPMNRAIYSFNDGVDKVVMKPLAQAYQAVFPAIVRTGVSNVFSNLNDIVVALNNLLQGKIGLAFSDISRVMINTTVGILGIMDVASDLGIEKNDEDFGQTLGYWGIGDGPYLVLPFIGPRNIRDTVGLVVDWETDPTSYIDPNRDRNAVQGFRLVTRRAELLNASKVLEVASLDEYEFLRDAYLQRRRNLIYDGNPPREKDDGADAGQPAARGVNLRKTAESGEAASIIVSGQPTPAEEEQLLKTQMAGDEVPRPNIRVWVSTPQQ
jgi:phospholipid-binding lipoprotein MlaA